MKTGTFFKLMGHSCAANVAQSFGITGRVLAPSAACATGCQAIGYAFEQIATGKQQAILCGGADELHPLTVTTFDIMNAASRQFNQQPAATPRPFDRRRDGIICGEGSGILLLENRDSAMQRGATILAEVIGFATTSDTSSIASPDVGAMATCMQRALDAAGIAAAEIDQAVAENAVVRTGPNGHYPGALMGKGVGVGAYNDDAVAVLREYLERPPALVSD